MHFQISLSDIHADTNPHHIEESEMDTAKYIRNSLESAVVHSLAHREPRDLGEASVDPPSESSDQILDDKVVKFLVGLLGRVQKSSGRSVDDLIDLQVNGSTEVFSLLREYLI